MQEAMNNVLSALRINGKCVRAESHRHLAFYDVAVEASSLRRLERSAKEIAISLRSKTIPIMKLVPELGVVRMQMALTDAKPVPLMSLMYGEKFPSEMVFPFLIGEDDNGKKFWMDMNHNPHLLVSGSTGSGKSILLHTLIANALFIHAVRFRNVWMYLSDPKRVEFGDYSHKSLNGIVHGISTTYEETVAHLKYLYKLMEKRYSTMRTLKMRSVEEDPQKFTLTLCIIDEVADLMMQDKKEGKLQDLLIKVAQKGRAAGIFLVLSTQRPSVDIITGTIKANFPGRIACKTASRKDSEVVLDRPGAETLLGRGDAVIQNMKHDSVRLQVAFATPEDTIKNFIWLKNYT
jgi:DNA segregation ATPase FtsK/SpoIIIE, S-DNA-T family